MFHQSQNNFRPYFTEYPFKENIVDKALESGEVSEQTVINAAHEQLEAMMTLKPFDPEDFGFTLRKVVGEALEEWSIITDNVRCFLKRDDTLNRNYWKIVFKVRLTHLGEDPFDDEAFIGMDANVAHIYLPHDMAGRITLTALGIIQRKDIEAGACVDDPFCEGVCPFCENQGRCVNHEKTIYQKAHAGEDGEKVD